MVFFWFRYQSAKNGCHRQGFYFCSGRRTWSRRYSVQLCWVSLFCAAMLFRTSWATQLCSGFLWSALSLRLFVSLFAYISEELGRVDILFNCAGSVHLSMLFRTMFVLMTLDKTVKNDVSLK